MQQFPDIFLGDFNFTFSSSINKESTGNLTACDTLNTANVTYVTGMPKLIKLGYSGKIIMVSFK